MITAILSMWLASGAASPAHRPGGDLHLVFRSEFDYMARVRVVTHEVWLGDRKSAARQGDRLVITRTDLGLTWRLDLKAGTYSEAKTPSAPEPQSAAAPSVDMRTVGWDWEPEYDWQVAETGATATIAGRTCREFAADGSADYAEADVRFWTCEPIAGTDDTPTDAVLGTLRSVSARKMILDTVAGQGKSWVLRVEETQEPAIAPTMVIRVRVESLEVSEAPAGTFDLPPNVKKAGK